MTFQFPTSLVLRDVHDLPKSLMGCKVVSCATKDDAERHRATWVSVSRTTVEGSL